MTERPRTTVRARRADEPTDETAFEEATFEEAETTARRRRRSPETGSDPTTEFTFVPVARSGYRPTETFERGAKRIEAAGETRIDLDVRGRGEAGEITRTVSVDVSIYGPGAVTGIDTDQVVRMEPEPHTQEFPPNQFPLIEFDNPELPWRYSPQRADGHGRNRPWLCLVALREDRIEYEPAGVGPLPVVRTPTDELPDPAESWAWAHAQHVGAEDLEEAFSTDSTHTRSRLLCPRNLSTETKYRACVVPTFEPGRRAGLGLKPEDNGDSIGFAWEDERTVRLPVYHSWTFRTDAVGDFEYLARLLEPVEFGPGIGFKTIDVTDPGPVDLKLSYDPETDQGIVGLGGALRSIGAEPITYTMRAKRRLRELLNQPREIEELTKEGEHGKEVGYGAVGPHLYGQWHAGVPELEDPEGANDYPRWFDELNTDPRHRIAAGYGTQVIQREADRLLHSAWEQFGELREANRKLHRLQVDELVLTDRFRVFETLPMGTMMSLTAPLHGSVRTGTTTLHARTVDSDQPTELTSPAFRRLTRSTGPLARRPGMAVNTPNFNTRLETGRVPRLTDGLAFTVDSEVGDEETEEVVLESGRALLEPDFGPPGETNIIADVADPSAFFDTGAGLAVDTELVEAVADRLAEPEEPATMEADRAFMPLSERNDIPETVRDGYSALDSLDEECSGAREAISTFSHLIRREDQDAIDVEIEDFSSVHEAVVRIERAIDSVETALEDAVAGERLEELRLYHRRCLTEVERAIELLRSNPDGFRAARDALDRTRDALTSIEGVTMRLRVALDARSERIEDDTTALAGTTVEEIEIDGIDVETLGAQPLGASTPRELSIPKETELTSAIAEGFEPTKRLYGHAGTALGIPTLEEREDPLGDVMAAPTFTEPTFRLLAELDEEYLLPGVESIPTNSMGTLVTNPEFIEAFMTGLIHEMARELQWHRFPTDRRGTYFRRFWNRKGAPGLDPHDPEAMADIEPIHTWTGNSLGKNSPRDDEATVVLLIRGELLRRYPTTDVFAVKAVEDEGDRTPALPRTHVMPEDDEDDEIAYPIFRGTLSSDITFFGFSLTVEEALYAPYDRETADDHADEGWFFVLQEAPGEPRFGLDVGAEEDVGEVPPGITDGDGRLHQLGSDADAGPADHGWSAVSWAHLVDNGDPNAAKFVDVSSSRPGRETWRVEAGSSFEEGGNHEYGREDAAEWGHNSAHMAIATWIRPIRVSIHAADMIADPDREAMSRGKAATARLVDYPRPIVRLGGIR
jgi:hypothetical protein